LAKYEDSWRRVAKRSRKEKIRNLEIREMFNVQNNVIEVSEKRQLTWF
jgi:hypothetical protein